MWLVFSAAVVAHIGLAKHALAQSASVPTISGFQPILPQVPDKIPPAAERFRAASSFIDSLGKKDAMFEVIFRQGRLLTTHEDIWTTRGEEAVIAVGDPTVLDYHVINRRTIRLLGQSIGVTDLAVTTSDGRTYTYEVHVVYDLDLLRAQLRQMFPNALLKLAQMREHMVVEGQARSAIQVDQIIKTIRAFLDSEMVSREVGVSGQQEGATPSGPGAPPRRRGEPYEAQPDDEQAPEPEEEAPGVAAAPQQGPRPAAPPASVPEPQIINLIRVPGPQQVLLKVQVAELNRTALREIGADLIGVDPSSGSIVGSQIAGGAIQAFSTLAGGGLIGGATADTAANTTVFGIFESDSLAFLLRALRRNSLLRILAEPNLVTMNGQAASFLAGGEIPIPVPQSGGGGGAATITIQYKEFGVRLGFVPYILEDGTIRLSVDPEVSELNFANGTVIQGSIVPALDVRRVHTVVELRQGQTLAIGGLLQIEMSATTSRIPGLGDLPYIGPFFSNTSSNRIEKEMVVLVTPYLIEAMNEDQVPGLPGDEIKEPNDLEFYLLNRLEARTGRDFRSTTKWDDPLDLVRRFKLEHRYIRGPHGYSD